MWDERDRERLEELERRVAALEARALGPATDELADGVPIPLEEESPTRMPPPLPRRSVAAAASEGQAAAVSRDILAAEAPVATAPPAGEDVYALAEAVGASAEPPYVPRAHAQVPTPSHARLEQFIGLKGAGWVGAIVLVLGAAFGIKYGYDQGYFGGVPAEARVGLMALAGLLLIGAGEWVYRRVNRLSAVGLYGAGVAVLFLVAYFGHAYYALYSRDAALTLMGAVMLIGSAVAMRGRMVSVAVLALLGGNIAPLVLHGEVVQIVPLLSYLLMLQGVALLLAYWGASRRWWVLRTLCGVTTGLWMAAVIGGAGSVYSATGAPLGFALVYAALFQLELVLSACRGGVKGYVREDRPRLDARIDVAKLPKAGLIFSMGVTAVLTAALLWIFADATALVRGWWVLGLAAALGACGWVVPIVLGDKTRALGMGYRVQAAALVVVSVPVLWEGPWVVIGWGVLAVAFAAVGALLDLEISKRAAVLTWLLAAGWGFWWWQDVSTHQAALATWVTVGQTPLAVFLIVGWLLTVAAHAVSLLTLWRREAASEPAAVAPDLLRLTWFVQTCGGLVLVVVSIAGLPTLTATVALVAYAWLLAVGDIPAPKARLIAQAGAVLALAMAKWVVVDLLEDRLASGWSAGADRPVLNPLMGVGALIAASVVGIYMLRRRRITALCAHTPGGDPATMGVFVGGVVVMLLAMGLSFEIDRVVELARSAGTLVWPTLQAKQLGWTMLWMIASGAFMGLIVKLEPPGARRSQWLRAASVPQLLLAVKYLTFDTLSFRGMTSPARVAVGANMQILAGVIVIAGLLLVYVLAGVIGKNGTATEQRNSMRRSMAGFAAVLTLLCMGTLEIDRYFTLYFPGANPVLARAVGFSIFWSLFAIGCVVAGFAARVAALRYFGLALFAVTLGKVVIVDMAEVSTGYRILSFMALGLLLLGTSVVYGRRTRSEVET